jgi:hypothetical protein
MKTFDQLILEEKSKERLIYFDTEFTGLHQMTTLISIGCITDDGKTFYAEYTDFDKDQVTDWIKENVFPGLKYVSMEGSVEPFMKKDVNQFEAVGDKEYVKEAFWKWIGMLGYKKIRMYSDCLTYDWMLFNEYYADEKDGMKDLRNINYIPLDLCTDLYRAKVDPDVNREEFAEYEGEDEKHNALHDAKIIRKCHAKLNDEEL